ncbi:uncharacterized protein EKO05_0003913 [Ascochyta rabiei]|uniref:uncharacterized protein n=1 Tax=Didymella rabiei TaxID=5454 RepID=UPI0022074C89|nr:uncharacterized protein EKO05_0003904 [Ascochyta rabiei]XP_059492251.1 uncharacterized protein EKO05_0003913 [Ascochyta rabiei]UPX13395.1 hypothetical protein EKO05_0003904 [Ascochyta rabiei]UPX13404.1 hypothetical protein EKO05_0003913 [Ascochyta rabiei]
MRFQLVYVLAALAVAPSLAAPTADQGKGLIDPVTTDLQLKAGENSLEDQASGLVSFDKRTEGQYTFTFINSLRGAVRNIGGVAISLFYNKGDIFVTIHNHLAQDISAYIEEWTKREDIMALTVPAGQKVEWTLHAALYEANDVGKFFWKTNY